MIKLARLSLGELVFRYVVPLSILASFTTLVIIARMLFVMLFQGMYMVDRVFLIPEPILQHYLDGAPQLRDWINAPGRRLQIIVACDIVRFIEEPVENWILKFTEMDVEWVWGIDKSPTVVRICNWVQAPLRVGSRLLSAGQK